MLLEKNYKINLKIIVDENETILKNEYIIKQLTKENAEKLLQGKNVDIDLNSEIFDTDVEIRVVEIQILSIENVLIDIELTIDIIR